MRRLARLSAFALVLALAAPASADETIRIGVLTDMAGPNGDLAGQGSVLAAQLAAEDAAKLLPGRKIEILQGDHQNKADIGAGIAARWFDEQGVDAVADMPFSSVALAVQEVARRRNKITLFSGPGSSDLTGKACSLTGFHFTFDTKALGAGTAAAITKAGGDSWFFITSDYAFGHALERDSSAVVVENGGKVVGAVRHPPFAPDLSSFLLQAQASKAKVIGAANAATDIINTIRQAQEFGIVQGGQKIAGLLVFISEIHALGLKTAKGLQLTESFYWDMDDKTREWSARFAARHGGKKPTMVHAGVYSGVFHFLKGVAAAGTKDGLKVGEAMRATPVNDFMSRDVKILANGWVQRDFHLFEVKGPEDSKGPWDYYKLVTTIPGKEIRPESAVSACPLVAQK
ncbi:ABC transporter substrate-binding protein [Enterovirga rhinocerotis]|uniref:Branched-chain amino acid transport system substrate-binding protein n=1 Tax=Enterovirga rhinocerotis TaxID=1339210 RepID=A0A4V6PZJ1_9HYPH|nr:ABC transporter substrate-binding protein [Enterovirga rhinocerotis]TDR89959.1 branched-chain amino acid transport system substrate-binding protein [Enterovirga rhinocerotis]